MKMDKVRKKKILFVVESLSGGGAEKVLVDILKKINRNMYEISIFTVIDTGVYSEQIKAYCDEFRYCLNNYSENDSFFKRMRYKILYYCIYHFPTSFLAGKIEKELYDTAIGFVEGFSTKIVSNLKKAKNKIAWIHIDMVQNPYADKYYKNIEEHIKTYQRFNKIVCVSQSVKKVFEEKFHFSSERVEVIYNPIDKNNINIKAEEQCLKKKKDVIRIVSVGRLVHQKGYDRLISVLGELYQDFPDFQYELLILGDGTEKERLIEQIKIYGLDDKIRLCGFCENPYPYIKSADVFLSCSRAEGYSLVVAEALILGKPIIACDCSGPNELLGYGKYGILIENNKKAIKETLVKIFKKEIDLAYWAKMAKERSYFFDYESIIREIEDLF